MTRALRCLPGCTLLLLLVAHPPVFAHGNLPPGHIHCWAIFMGCDSGDTASCIGHQSCAVYDHWVTCDGASDACEPCTGYCLNHPTPVATCFGAWCEDDYGVAHCGSFKNNLDLFYCPHFCTEEAPQSSIPRPGTPPGIGEIERLRRLLLQQGEPVPGGG